MGMEKFEPSNIQGWSVIYAGFNPVVGICWSRLTTFVEIYYWN